jgi:hypothetical protein
MLFVGDDWAEDHHDVTIVDDTGGVLARRRLSNGLDGITVLHALIGEGFDGACTSRVAYLSATPLGGRRGQPRVGFGEGRQTDSRPLRIPFLVTWSARGGRP